MKRHEAVIASTHVDAHGDKLTREALDSIATAIARSYIPIGVEHDPRIPPQGRVASGTVRQRSDGEFELAAIVELFDGSNEAEVTQDPRELAIRRYQQGALSISHDRTYETQADQEDIRAIAKMFGTEPIEDFKKAVEPVSIITIGGVFVLGAIATGFLNQLGVEAWSAVRDSLGKLFSRKTRRKGDQLFMVVAQIEVSGAIIEAEAILTNPTSEDIKTLMTSGLQTLDQLLPACLLRFPDARRLVFEVNDGKLQLKFAVMRDCRALRPREPNAE